MLTGPEYYSLSCLAAYFLDLGQSFRSKRGPAELAAT